MKRIRILKAKWQYKLFFLGVLLSQVVSAGDLPCTPSVLKKTENHDSVLSSEKTPALYFIHNHSTQSLWIEHPTQRKGASAGWSSYLRAGNWSALLLNQASFLLHCAVMTPGKIEALDCGSALTVCLSSSAELPKKKSYWVAEDQTWEEMQKTLKKRNIS